MTVVNTFLAYLLLGATVQGHSHSHLPGCIFLAKSGSKRLSNLPQNYKKQQRIEQTQIRLTVEKLPQKTNLYFAIEPRKTAHPSLKIMSGVKKFRFCYRPARFQRGFMDASLKWWEQRSSGHKEKGSRLEVGKSVGKNKNGT